MGGFRLIVHKSLTLHFGSKEKAGLSCLLKLGGLRGAEKLDPCVGPGGLAWVFQGSVLVCFSTDKIKIL